MFLGTMNVSLGFFSWFSDRKINVLLVFGILLDVSQHALGGVVEGYEGTDSVLLPYQYPSIVPEVDPSVLWSRDDLSPKVIHLRNEQGDDLKDQNQHYRGRTSMSPDALDNRDFSLTLRKPQLSDSGTYTCSLSDGRIQDKLIQVQLKVKDNPVEVKVNEHAESVILPCKTFAGLKEDTRVEWTRSDSDFKFVHLFPNTSKHNTKQDDHYCGRTKMNVDLLRIGDLSLTLKFPTDRDSGSYICTVYRDEDILRQRVILHHITQEPFPIWATVLLVSVVLLAVVVGAGIFHFKYYLKTVDQVKVDSGAESILLPFRLPIPLHQNVTVEWTDSNGKKVYVYSKDPDCSKEQHKAYKGRAKMNENQLKLGVCSLTIENPALGDRNTYTCTIYRKGKKLIKKQVMLDVKVDQVKVESGAESVLLPCKILIPLPQDIKVEWTDNNRKTVYVYSKDPDCSKVQDKAYKGRTEMNEDQLKNGVCSLTLKYPLCRDRNTYSCTVYEKGKKLIKKQVMLAVEVQQVKGESGAVSVILPFETSADLTKGYTVEWRDNKKWIMHMFQHDHHRPNLQHWYYRGRTEMKKNPLKDKDLSLTVSHLTESEVCTCTVYNKEGDIILRKEVELCVEVPEVVVESGDDFVLLLFNTEKKLECENLEVHWMNNSGRKIHVYRQGSDQPDDQYYCYRFRTELNEEKMKNNGDFSLTLKYPTDWDTDHYTCNVYGTDGTILRKKRVDLKVKEGLVKVKEGDHNVQLPFKTTPELLKEPKVKWFQIEPRYRTVHEFEDGSDKFENQDESFKDRTRMNKDPLGTGDLSLTLERLREEDLGKYKCIISGKEKRIIQEKTIKVQKEGTFQMQDKPKDSMSRRNSVDEPLMADNQIVDPPVIG